MTHHTMNQMGDEFPNLIGIRTEGLDQKMRKLVPGYMTMGNEGMALKDCRRSLITMLKLCTRY